MDQLSAADKANQLMVDLMIAEGALWSPPLIAAFRATPRHRFLDRIYQFQTKHNRWREIITREPGTQELRLIYSDRALITHLSSRKRAPADLPISSSSQPSLMAQMLEDLRLSEGLRVLEIGSGTGYNAALMAHVVGPERVTSVDVDQNVLAEAWDHLRAFPERAVQLKHVDGRQGYPDSAPYDRLMVTAATPHLEPAWLEQLADKSLLSAPLTLSPGLAFVVCGSVQEGMFQGRLQRAAYFMPLRAEDEWGSPEAESGPDAEALQSVPAPWADWLERRRSRFVWLRLVQSLVFYALLRGLTIDHRSGPEGQVLYGIRDDTGQQRCWFGAQQWQVSGREGRELGWKLWRAFLDAGGPWPTEFQLRVCINGAVPLSGHKEEYVRHAGSNRQVWELLPIRERTNWV
jgi:protein-L-isoaspartate(D-aspartate) O-methyltransferase